MEETKTMEINEEITTPIEETHEDDNDLLVPVEDEVSTQETQDESGIPPVVIGAAAVGGAALIAVGVRSIIKKIRGKKATSTAEEQPDQPDAQKREKTKMVKGAKLTVIERLTGHRYDPAEDAEETQEEKA